jgi:cysteine desulfurase
VNRRYFDHNATTPVSPVVLDVYMQALQRMYGNASSIHRTGQEARQALEQARRQVASYLSCEPKEVIFTSGGTEADNLAVFGVVRASRKPRRRVITTAIEHPAVLNACMQLEREDVEVLYVPPGGDGVVDPEAIRRCINADTVLISVMHANNEVGTIQPVAEIAGMAREHGIPFHSDGVQAAGKIPVQAGVDLYAVSAHKLYAPKGVGALRVRNGVALQPLMFGGRHEQGRRPGTENVPAALAFGAAVENISLERMDRVRRMRDRLESAILERVPGTRVNGAGAPRLPNTTNICFDGIGGEALVIALDLAGFAVSTGAACSSGAVAPSHVLTAMGLTARQARSSVRFSLGESNTEEDVDELVKAIVEAVERLRRVSPDWSPHD